MCLSDKNLAIDTLFIKSISFFKHFIKKHVTYELASL